MLQAATGGYYGGKPKDAVVTAPGRKPSLKNAPTNYIYDLMGVRLAQAVKDAPREYVSEATSCRVLLTIIARLEKGFRLCRPNLPPSITNFLRRDFPMKNW
jgi:hypothetical protein